MPVLECDNAFDRIFVIHDTETSSFWAPPNGAFCQIAFKFLVLSQNDEDQNWYLKKEHSTLKKFVNLYPMMTRKIGNKPREWAPRAMKITGITPSMVESAPSMKVVLQALANALVEYTNISFIAHNALFDQRQILGWASKLIK